MKKRLEIPHATFMAATFTLAAACSLPSTPAFAADLRIIAQTGSTVGNTTISSIPASGVFINNRGTIAFRAFTADDRSTMLAVTPDWQIKDLQLGGSAVNGFGVEANGCNNDRTENNRRQ